MSGNHLNDLSKVYLDKIAKINATTAIEDKSRWQDLGGPTPGNYNPTDDSAKIKEDYETQKKKEVLTALKKRDLKKSTKEKIAAVLASFDGPLEQIPPMYSAKHVNGQRLYKLARKNKTVERAPVRISIEQISLLDYTEPVITFNVTCSKGTYVRVLGADIAAKLGTVGHLTALTRTSVGSYHISDATTIEKLSNS